MQAPRIRRSFAWLLPARRQWPAGGAGGHGQPARDMAKGGSVGQHPTAQDRQVGQEGHERAAPCGEALRRVHRQRCLPPGAAHQPVGPVTSRQPGATASRIRKSVPRELAKTAAGPVPGRKSWCSARPPISVKPDVSRPPGQGGGSCAPLRWSRQAGRICRTDRRRAGSAQRSMAPESGGQGAGCLPDLRGYVRQRQSPIRSPGSGPARYRRRTTRHPEPGC